MNESSPQFEAAAVVVPVKPDMREWERGIEKANRDLDALVEKAGRITPAALKQPAEQEARSESARSIQPESQTILREVLVAVREIGRVVDNLASSVEEIRSRMDEDIGVEGE